MKRQHLRYLSGVLVVALCLLTSPSLSALSDTAVVYSAAKCVQNGMLDEDTIRGLYNGINAVTRATQYNESGTNTSFSSADTIPVDEAAGSETHMFGKISSSNTADYYKITPPRHGRIYVMLLSPTGYSYNLTVYNSNENVLSCDYSTSTTKSFMATKGTKTSANLASSLNIEPCKWQK